MYTKFEVKERTEVNTICIRTHSPVENLKNVLGASYGAVAQHIMSHGGQIIDAPYVAYFNMDMTNLDLEIGFPVAAPLSTTNNISTGKLPAGKYITTIYTGPYEEMVAVYDALNEFMKENGHQPTGTAYEFYLNGPETPPAELQTRIEFPLIG